MYGILSLASLNGTFLGLFDAGLFSILGENAAAVAAAPAAEDLAASLAAFFVVKTIFDLMFNAEHGICAYVP